LRRLKRKAGLLLAGFLLFAPPGTLVVGALLLLGLFRNYPWVVAGLILAAAALLAAQLYRRGFIRRFRQ
jgi:chromate transport protein ChrA